MSLWPSPKPQAHDLFCFFIILNLKTNNVADNDRQAEKKLFFFFIIFIFIFHKKFMILIYKRNNTMCIKYMWLRKMTRDSSLFHQVLPATSSVFGGLFLMLSLSCVQITCAHPRILAKANLATRPLLCAKLFFPIPLWLHAQTDKQDNNSCVKHHKQSEHCFAQ